MSPEAQVYYLYHNFVLKDHKTNFPDLLRFYISLANHESWYKVAGQKILFKFSCTFAGQCVSWKVLYSNVTFYVYCLIGSIKLSILFLDISTLIIISTFKYRIIWNELNISYLEYHFFIIEFFSFLLLQEVLYN